MKKQLTDQEIAKAHSLYLYSKVYYRDYTYCKNESDYEKENNRELNYLRSFGPTTLTTTYASSITSRDVSKIKLLLKPLSEISDEDATTLYHLYCGFIAKYDYTQDYQGILAASKHWLQKGGIDEISKYSVLSDTAKNMGYDVKLFFVPNHWANGKTAIELGIAIPETTSHNQQ